jgi:NAD(P)-dependent dehydrogenase (short-subunit alcohol dehydrogenase family)
MTAEITAQLLLHGIEKVIIVARSEDRYITAREEWRYLKGNSSELDTRTEFVKCDLEDIQDVKIATQKIKQVTDRIHILFCNAGELSLLCPFSESSNVNSKFQNEAIGIINEHKCSPQNIERVFATNCVGHQVLATLLLPLLKRGVVRPDNSDVRIVVTSSSFHLLCQQLDLELLSSSSRVKWPALYDGVWRYGRSKLGNILFAKELSRRLLIDGDPASKHIYVNSFFPGNIVTDQWLGWDSYFGGFIGWLMRATGSCLGQTLEDGAATALYLAASREVRDQNLRGEYFIPIATPCDSSAVAGNRKLARDLWVSVLFPPYRHASSQY